MLQTVLKMTIVCDIKNKHYFLNAVSDTCQQQTKTVLVVKCYYRYGTIFLFNLNYILVTDGSKMKHNRFICNGMGLLRISNYVITIPNQNKL